MDNSDVLQRNADGELEVRVVNGTEKADAPANYDDVFTVNSEGKRALRVVGAGGGGGASTAANVSFDPSGLKVLIGDNVQTVGEQADSAIVALQNAVSVLQTSEELNDTIGGGTTVNLTDLTAMEIDGRPSYKEPGATVYAENGVVGVIDTINSDAGTANIITVSMYPQEKDFTFTKYTTTSTEGWATKIVLGALSDGEYIMYIKTKQKQPFAITGPYAAFGLHILIQNGEVVSNAPYDSDYSYFFPAPEKTTAMCVGSDKGLATDDYAGNPCWLYKENGKFIYEANIGFPFKNPGAGSSNDTDNEFLVSNIQNVATGEFFDFESVSFINSNTTEHEMNFNGLSSYTVVTPNIKYYNTKNDYAYDGVSQFNCFIILSDGTQLAQTHLDFVITDGGNNIFDAILDYNSVGLSRVYKRRATGIFSDAVFALSSDSQELHLIKSDFSNFALPNTLYFYINGYATNSSANLLGYFITTTEQESTAITCETVYADLIQAKTMPSILSLTVGNIYQYIGETTAEYEKGGLYEATGTLTTVPESATAHNIRYLQTSLPAEGITITVNFDNLLAAMRSSYGQQFPPQELQNYDYYYYSEANQFQADGAGILPNNCFVVDGSPSQDIFWNVKYNPSYQTVNDGAWKRINPDPNNITTDSNIVVEELSNGYVRMSGIASIGLVAQGSTTEQEVAFPDAIDMADTNYNIQVSATSAGGMAEINAGYSEVSTTGFTIGVRSFTTTSEATNVSVSWVVFGKKATTA